MSIPYTPGLVAKVLSAMPAEQLAAVSAQDFQRWPTANPLPAAIGRELIAAERARRAA